MTPQAQTAERQRLKTSYLEAKKRCLTNRESQVLALLSEGLSNKQIAHSMGISPKTADCHRTRLYQKLGINSMGQAILYAIRNGYATLEREDVA